MPRIRGPWRNRSDLENFRSPSKHPTCKGKTFHFVDIKMHLCDGLERRRSKVSHPPTPCVDSKGLIPKATIFERGLRAVTTPTKALMVALIPEQRIIRTAYGNNMIRQFRCNELLWMPAFRVNAQRMMAQTSSAILLPPVSVATFSCTRTRDRRVNLRLVIFAVTTADQPRTTRPRTWTFRHRYTVQFTCPNAHNATRMACVA